MKGECDSDRTVVRVLGISLTPGLGQRLVLRPTDWCTDLIRTTYCVLKAGELRNYTKDELMETTITNMKLRFAGFCCLPLILDAMCLPRIRHVCAMYSPYVRHVCAMYSPYVRHVFRRFCSTFSWKKNYARLLDSSGAIFRLWTSGPLLSNARCFRQRKWWRHGV